MEVLVSSNSCSDNQIERQKRSREGGTRGRIIADGVNRGHPGLVHGGRKRVELLHREVVAAFEWLAVERVLQWMRRDFLQKEDIKSIIRIFNEWIRMKELGQDLKMDPTRRGT